METKTEQFIQVAGVIHDPFKDFHKQDPFSSLEIHDTASIEDDDKQAFSEKLIQYSARNYRSGPKQSLRGEA